ncbi:MAG: peptidoglycan-binding domain-containing protein, partial [Myxococcota bacterium]
MLLFTSCAALILLGCASGGDAEVTDGGGSGDDSGPGIETDTDVSDSGQDNQLDCVVVSCDQAIFVDIEDGNDANGGTKQAPLATISIAIEAAAAADPPKAVLIGTGVYEDSVELRPGVSLYGGFDPDQDWLRDSVLYGVELRGGLLAMVARDIEVPTVVDGMVISTASAGPSDFGQSAIGILASNARELTLRDVIVTTGNGGPGQDGLPGNDGSDSFNGGAGNPGCEESGSIFCNNCTRPAGGISGGSFCARSGGQGGRPGRAENAGDTGAAGTGGTPGGAGGPGNGNGDGITGEDGDSGEDGANGNGGEWIGSFTENGYVPADGVSGANTRAAIRRYQERVGLPVNGEIDGELVAALDAED